MRGGVGAGEGLVKPPPFEYHAPSTVEETLGLLDDGAQVLAGGQSLLQLLKFRAVRPSALVDVNGVTGLDTIEERDGELHVGALVRQQTLLEDETVARGWPLLREATKFVGYKATRHRGTLGGSLAFAAPWAELSAAAVALDAKIEVRSAGGERTLDARSFFLGPRKTALQAGELITGVRFPKSPPGAAFHEVSARYRDYAQVAAAAVVTPGEKAEVVLLCVADTPYVLEADPDTLEFSLDGLAPRDDVEASAGYRRRVAPVLARRALQEAKERAA
jgi:carbon-monoxide dehydrogenase medium subunit